MSKLQCCKCHKYFEIDQLNEELICRSCVSGTINIFTYCQCGAGISRSQWDIFKQCMDCHKSFLEDEEEINKSITGHFRPV
jgi:hypothetical protein